MWQTEHTIDTDLAPEAVWAALAALETGEAPMGNGDRREANGPFEVGTTISATPVGIATLESTITELTPRRVLAVQTNFNDLVLLLRHVLIPLDGGGTRIVRQLEITGAGADEQGPRVGPRISEDYPQALEELVAVAGDGA
jgi:hypothetical protein